MKRVAGITIIAGTLATIIGLCGPGSVISGQKAPGTVALIPLQPLIDAAKDNATLVLEPGHYAGPILITKPLTLEGQNKVTIDGGGKGTVITLKTNGATIRNLHITNSGDQHNEIDAGVHIEGNFNVVKDNVIDECLFGVDLQQANNNVVRRNRISSKSDAELGVKGDAVRLWYSLNNRVEDNDIAGARDMVVWYSADNRITGNTVRDGRYGLHFMYSRYNLVERNTIHRNAVGIFLMYSDDVIVRKNRIFQAQGATGIGIGLKETSNVEIADNEILYNASGIYLDLSPFQPDTTNRIYRNQIAFNDLGVVFLNDWHSNVFKDNVFWSNIRPVSVRSFASAARNVWEGNYWDDYQGFDHNDDGIGDTPYIRKVYADRLWMDLPEAAFFKATPLLTALDFVERLAPFTEPLIMLRDKKPRMGRSFAALTGDEAAKEASSNENNGGQKSDPFGLHTLPGQGEGQTKRLDPFGLYKDK